MARQAKVSTLSYGTALALFLVSSSFAQTASAAPTAAGVTAADATKCARERKQLVAWSQVASTLGVDPQQDQAAIQSFWDRYCASPISKKKQETRAKKCKPLPKKKMSGQPKKPLTPAEVLQCARDQHKLAAWSQTASTLSKDPVQNQLQLQLFWNQWCRCPAPKENRPKR